MANNGTGNGDASCPQVGTFDVDLGERRDSSGLDNNTGSGAPSKQLSMSREQIEAKPNVLQLDKDEVALIREILFSKINLADFDKTEIERFTNDDHQIRRYIRLGQDRTSTLYRTAACIKACIEWRKSLELYNVTDSHFTDGPHLDRGVLQPHGKTVTGENILWVRAGHHRRQYNNEVGRKYLAYHMESIDRLSNECGFVVLVDCTGAGTSCIDLDFVGYFVKIVMFFRGNLRYVLVHDMGWLLGAAWKVIKSWLPQEQRDAVKMASKKELDQWVAREEWPDFMPAAASS